MPITRLAPDAIVEQTNLAGSLAAISDDPDAPDASWLTAASNNVDSICRVTFPSPAAALRVGATQEFRARVRKFGGSGTPQVRLELWEGGLLVASGANTNVTSTSGVVVALTWTRAQVADPSGANIECRVYGTKTGGSGSVRATIEVGAVEWNADHDVALEQHSTTVAITGGGAVAAASTSTRAPAAAISGGGALAAAPETVRSATVALSGGGELAVVANQTVTYEAIVAISGGGAIAVAVTTTRAVAVAISGGGVLAALAASVRSAVAALTGGGALGVAAASARAAVVALVGGGRLVVRANGGNAQSAARDNLFHRSVLMCR